MMKDGHMICNTLVFEAKNSSSDFCISSEFWNINGNNVFAPAIISDKPKIETTDPINFQFFTILSFYFQTIKRNFVYRGLTIYR